MTLHHDECDNGAKVNEAYHTRYVAAASQLPLTPRTPSTQFIFISGYYESRIDAAEDLDDPIFGAACGGAGGYSFHHTH
jgi:hypothetical protein